MVLIIGGVLLSFYFFVVDDIRKYFLGVFFCFIVFIFLIYIDNIDEFYIYYSDDYLLNFVCDIVIVYMYFYSVMR